MLSRVVCHVALVLDHSHNIQFVGAMWHGLLQPKSWAWFNFRYLTVVDASGETVAAGPQVVSFKINGETLRLWSQHQIWCERTLSVSQCWLHDAVSTHKELGVSPKLRPAVWIASWSDCFSSNLSAFHEHANLLVRAASSLCLFTYLFLPIGCPCRYSIKFMHIFLMVPHLSRKIEKLQGVVDWRWFLNGWCWYWESRQLMASI